jgi:molybdopterin converting factor small subunit
MGWNLQSKLWRNKTLGARDTEKNNAGILVARIKLKIVGLPQEAYTAKESVINANSTLEIIQSIETRYPEGVYTFNIFVNGVSVDSKPKELHDGDEVIVVPVISGG